MWTRLAEVESPVIGPQSIVIPVHASLFAAAGLVFGYGYFVSLRRTVDLYAVHRAWRRPLLWVLARVVAAALFFAVAARWSTAGFGPPARPWGALPLLAAVAGFLIARQLAVRSVRRTR